MMDIWSWICELPNSDQWDEANSPCYLELDSSRLRKDKTTGTIQLRAERFSGSNTEALTFTVCLGGFHSLTDQKILWTSDMCHLSSEKPFLPLVLQLLQEIITRSPTAHNSTCPRSKLQELKPEPVSWIMDSHSPESFSSFFNLLVLTRMFWLCVCDAPSEVGSMYFESLLGPNLEALSCNHAQVLRTFLVTVGVDVEICFMRTIGYILAKWLIFRQVGVGLQTLTPLPGQPLGFSYATESHGLWVLKGFTPVLGMKSVNSSASSKFPIVQANESVLKYALAHQQLEAVIQLEYSVAFHEGYIQVNARVDNLRFHVAKLGFRLNDAVDYYGEEKHFPSRVRVWVGPEVGATYVGGLSLGRSTGNAEKEVEMQRIVKSSSGNSKVSRMKARARMTTRTKRKNWRWDQDAEGNAAVFDAVLCDNVTGQEIASGGGGGGGGELGNRYGGENRAFTKMGGLVLCGDECGVSVGWRLGRDMEGSVLKWRIGGQVWLSYWPNHVKSSYYETRCVEWCDEVDLPLIPGK